MPENFPSGLSLRKAEKCFGVYIGNYSMVMTNERCMYIVQGTMSCTVLYTLVISKTKGQTFRYRFWKTKTFWYRSEICLIENSLFRFGPVSALLDQIQERTQMFWFHSYQILERLWNVCSFTVLTLLNDTVSEQLHVPHEFRRRQKIPFFIQ